jgi:hypothetical protein
LGNFVYAPPWERSFLANVPNALALKKNPVRIDKPGVILYLSSIRHLTSGSNRRRTSPASDHVARTLTESSTPLPADPLLEKTGRNYVWYKQGNYRW